MAVVSGKRDASGRDLVFEQWYADNIEAVEGGRVEQRAIFKAYRSGVVPGIALGEQGVERMLNNLGVKFSVRAGKRYRLGVGFKRQAAIMPLGAGHLPEAVTLSPPSVTFRKASSRLAAGPSPSGQAPSVTARLDDAADVERDRLTLLRIMAWEGSEEYPTVQAVYDVFRERRRQVTDEGFDAIHDDASDPGAHERAAACYAYAAGQPEHVTPFVDFNVKGPGAGRVGYIVRDTIVMMWPWMARFWKPKTDTPDWRRRCMVVAGALIVAAIERYDRDKARQALADSQASQMTGV